MNCQDITRLLDDGDIGSMTKRERSEVEAHLFACPDCAADWKVHQRLVEGFAPPMPAGLTERARALVAAGVTVDTRRSPRRAMLFGTMLVVAAAAALLTFWRSDPVEIPAVVEAPAPPPAARSVVESPGVAPPSVAPAVEVQAPERAAGPHRVLVPSLRMAGGDATAYPEEQRFRRVVIEKLRTVPNLVVLDPQTDEGDLRAEYEIRITLTAPDPMAPLGPAITIDPRTPAAFAALDKVIAAEAKMNAEEYQRSREERAIEESERRRSSIRPGNLFLSPGRYFPRSLFLGFPPAPAGAPDQVESQASRLVNDLRVQFLPLDISLEADLLAVLRDAAQKESVRMLALGDLVSIRERHGGLQAADAVMAAGAALASAARTLEREMIWAALASSGSPELVPHLSRALESAPQIDTRLQIVRILSADFSGDSRAREALELASRQNQQQVVRMAALRELGARSKWNEYVVATLNDASLTPMQRLQPIADMAPPDLIAATSSVQSEIQLSDQEIRGMAGLIISAARDNSPEGASRKAATQAVKALGPVGGPVVLDALIDIMYTPFDIEPPGFARAAIGTIKQAARDAIARNFVADPKARALIKALVGSPDLALGGLPAQSAWLLMEGRANQEAVNKQRESPPPRQP